jgi:hypothetical protein
VRGDRRAAGCIFLINLLLIALALAGGIAY